MRTAAALVLALAAAAASAQTLCPEGFTPLRSGDSFVVSPNQVALFYGVFSETGMCADPVTLGPQASVAPGGLVDGNAGCSMPDGSFVFPDPDAYACYRLVAIDATGGQVTGSDAEQVSDLAYLWGIAVLAIAGIWGIKELVARHVLPQ